MATAQKSDGELRSLLETVTGLKFKQLSLPSSKRFLYCDISTDKVGPYVPVSFRKKVFDLLHGLLRPGIKATTYLIKKRSVWSSINKDIQMGCSVAWHVRSRKFSGTLKLHWDPSDCLTRDLVTYTLMWCDLCPRVMVINLY
ncbi:hypothetical protein AVEN_137474-1 [Araneus ventricosus]|nr:hypothetical protein AVEN_137474-1 [Araneus ventricosus]